MVDQTDDITPWLARLPKVELHLHLEGSLRPATLFQLAQRNGVELGADSPAALTALYQFNDFNDFVRLFLAGLATLRTAEDFTDATVALAAELAEQNVRYAEVTTTPGNHHRRGIDMAEYRDGLNEGRRRARAEHGVDLAWVCDISRESEDPGSEWTVDYLLGPTAPDGVVGLGLGGVEDGYPPELFTSSFARARAAGLASLPHAGETVGAASVWGALRALRANRIGHGIRSLDDPALLDHLVAHDIPLEVAPTSNACLKLVPSVAEHPLAHLADAGVPVTLNTDDPAYFQTTLTTELLVAHRLHGFTTERLLAAQHTALAACYADPATKARIREELTDFAASTSADQP
ncbi:adenosine deaminase [Goodfellowiella coeruleoviolacea]|uniref:Aminodeoxyfutalosine deaminase n=1 Tax=Goodfellowiella coeruleoviolacea TaxID=334858 RepID=A0AAE3KN65_9PSEU|nr:adenosine deaminase [Goodfellowiella coeruleoviolacea]MCP2168368.1 aminodeoxyfutalosine deaminase [Goodfellowiella coeruleoviolacea]